MLQENNHPEFEPANKTIGIENIEGNGKPTLNVARRTAEVAMVGTELTPLNEAIRFGAMGVAIASGADPLLVGAVTGTATMAVEGGGALATAGLLTSKNGNKAIDWINKKLTKLHISPEAKFSGSAKAGIAFLGGSAIVSAVKYREQPEMTESEVRKYGFKSAVALAGSATIMGYGVAKGVELPGPEMVGAGLLSIAGLSAVYSRIFRKIRREQQDEGIDIDGINKKKEHVDENKN